MTQERPLRVVHVIGALNRGGTETWLVNLLDRIDRKEVQMDFLVQQSGDPELETEVRVRGAQIVLVPRNVLWPIQFARALRHHGPYDIVHSHRNLFSAAVLSIAKLTVSSRLIAHSHTSYETRNGLRARLIGLGVRMARTVINRLADARLATSNDATRFLFGDPGSDDGDPRIIFCGLDMPSLLEAMEQQAEGKKDGPQRHHKAVGHVGAFKPVKNHAFILDVFEQLIQMDPSWELVLIGDGPLRREIEERAQAQALSGKIRFLGSRNNVFQILVSQVDVFVFPSKHEGLGLALVEAQVAGVPCVASNVVPDQAIVFRDRVRSLPLAAPASEWAMAITDAYEPGRKTSTANELSNYGALDVSVSAGTVRSIYESMRMPAGTVNRPFDTLQRAFGKDPRV